MAERDARQFELKSRYGDFAESREITHGATQ